jgi:hypothetical protein
MSQSKDQWPTLDRKWFGKLETAGIMSCDALIEAIKEWGLYPGANDGKYWFGGSEKAPYVRNVGRMAWENYFAMLDHVGFDYRPYIGTRHGWMGRRDFTEEDLKKRIEHKIGELIDLLKEFRELQQ